MGDRIQLDCRGRTSRDLLEILSPRLHRPGLVIVVENLFELEDSVAGFLKDLVRQIVSHGSRASLVDTSGYAAAMIDLIGGKVPLAALSSEKEVPKPRRILVVEDHKDSLEFLCTVLTSAGHECVSADSAESAIRRIDSHSFDLVLLDLILPGKDGTAVAQHLLDRKTPIPVIAISAYLDQYDDATFNRLGIRGRIGKPYRVAEILDAVRKV